MIVNPKSLVEGEMGKRLYLHQPLTIKGKISYVHIYNRMKIDTASLN